MQCDAMEATSPSFPPRLLRLTATLLPHALPPDPAGGTSLDP
jgi:hypothetical protein